MSIRILRGKWSRYGNSRCARAQRGTGFESSGHLGLINRGRGNRAELVAALGATAFLRTPPRPKEGVEVLEGLASICQNGWGLIAPWAGPPYVVGLFS